MTSRKGSSMPYSSSSISSSWGQYAVAPTTTTDDDYTDTCTDVSTINAIYDHSSYCNVTSTLPDVIANVVTLRHPVLAWTQLDPRIGKDKINRYFCLSSFGPLLFLPCFWPHLTIIWPCLLSTQVYDTNQVVNTYWILTTHELIVTVMDNNGGCCISGCYRTGVTIKTIPLETIIDVGIDRNGKGILNGSCCMEDITKLYFDTTASHGQHHAKAGPKHEAVGIGLENCDWFMQQVLSARDAIRHQQGASTCHYNNSCSSVGTVELSSLHQSSPMIMNRHNDLDSTVVPVIANRVMESSATTVAVGITTEQRFDEVKRLYDNGYITETEYQTKRQDILSSL